LLLLDEPLGALDRSLRENLLNELRTILHQSRIPVVYVTHDQEEAFALADCIMILHEGRIIREGTPSEVWAKPGSVYAAKFLGLGNILNGETVEFGNKVSTPSGIFDLKCDHPHQVGENVQLLVRPVQVTDEANVISGRVTDVIFQQERYKVMMDNGMFFYLAQPVNIGDEISVKVKLECLA
jgi:ABC-type Fe3+/spermidine/putrescine transport system ATPase subunit